MIIYVLCGFYVVLMIVAFWVVVVMAKIGEKLNLVMDAVHDLEDALHAWEVRMKNGHHVNGSRFEKQEPP